MTRRRIICQPFGSCDTDFAFFPQLGRRPAAGSPFPTGKPGAVTYLTTETNIGASGGHLYDFTWFDFVLPGSYNAGDSMTVQIIASVMGSGTYNPTQCALNVFGMQMNGGAYDATAGLYNLLLTNAHFGSTNWYAPPNRTDYWFCTTDYVSTTPAGTIGLKAEYVTPSPAVISFTVPGTTWGIQGGFPFFNQTQGGGEILIPSTSVPVGDFPTAGAGYNQAVGGYYPWDYFAGPACGYTSTAFPGTPQVAAGFFDLTAGASMSFGIYGFASGSGAGNFLAISDIKVVTTGGVKTDVPITNCKCGWAAATASSVGVNTPLHFVDHTVPPGGLSQNDFYLRTF